MKRQLLPLALLTACALPASAALINRYSFSETSGVMVNDSVGGAHGTVIGSGASWTGNSVSLPGGAGATADAAYVDLPNGLLSSHRTVTFEAWYTMRGVQSWSRVWDFGSSAIGEIGGTGSGNHQGQDYFIFAPNRGTNISQQRYTIRNLDPADGVLGGTGPVDGDEEAFDTNLSSILDQEYHIAGVWDTDGSTGTLTLYRDGVNLGGRATTFAPGDINDVNNWLGRSNWTGDAYFQGELNEFRIWDNAFDDDFAAASFAAGPDSVIPEPVGVALIGLSGFMLLLRRRR